MLCPCLHLREDSRNTLYTDKMEFHAIELPKLPEELKEDSSDILLWAKFINSERKEEFEMIAEKNTYIGSAYRKLQTISQDRQMQLEYEAREKAVRDYNQMMKEAREEGEKIGREKGEKIGREKGEKIGREKGEKIGREAAKQEALKRARDMIKDGLSLDKVAQYSGLSLQEIKNL